MPHCSPTQQRSGAAPRPSPAERSVVLLREVAEVGEARKERGPHGTRAHRNRQFHATLSSYPLAPLLAIHLSFSIGLFSIGLLSRVAFCRIYACLVLLLLLLRRRRRRRRRNLKVGWFVARQAEMGKVRKASAAKWRVPKQSCAETLYSTE